MGLGLLSPSSFWDRGSNMSSTLPHAELLDAGVRREMLDPARSWQEAGAGSKQAVSRGSDGTYIS